MVKLMQKQVMSRYVDMIVNDCLTKACHILHEEVYTHSTVT